MCTYSYGYVMCVGAEAVLAEADALAARQHEQLQRLQADCALLHAAFEALTVRSAERIETLGTQLASAAEQRDALTVNLSECTRVNEALRLRLRALDSRVAKLTEAQPPLEPEPLMQDEDADSGGRFTRRPPLRSPLPDLFTSTEFCLQNLSICTLT